MFERGNPSGLSLMGTILDVSYHIPECADVDREMAASHAVMNLGVALGATVWQKKDLNVCNVSGKGHLVFRTSMHGRGMSGFTIQLIEWLSIVQRVSNRAGWGRTPVVLRSRRHEVTAPVAEYVLNTLSQATWPSLSSVTIAGGPHPSDKDHYIAADCGYAEVPGMIISRLFKA